MKKTIELGTDFKIDLPILMESRLLVQANSGGGKSYILRRLLEQTHGQVQQIVIDYEGEFYTLREKFNYVLVGASGDVPINLRSAVLLAQRLLKLEASAIIDLSELPAHERKPYVRLFLDAIMEARSAKEYHTPLLLVIDEAHKFAPEKEQSEASAAVIDIMTRGRKRNICGVLATQRISKLSKDAAAEANNKVIGRCALDLDRKRGAEELGFNTKEETLGLRTLAPGEFYAFGTALTPDVRKVHGGDVQTTPKPKKSASKKVVIPAPQSVIKTMLKELADLPQEAEKEKKTVATLEQQVRELTRQLKERPVVKPVQDQAPMGVSQWLNYGKKYDYYNFFEKQIAERVIKAAVLKRDREWEANSGQWKAYARRLKKVLTDAAVILKNGEVLLDEAQLPPPVPPPQFEKAPEMPPPPAPSVQTEPVKPNPHPGVIHVPARYTESLEIESGITQGERKVLVALAQSEDGLSREHLTLITSYKRSTRDKYIQLLQQKRYVTTANDKVLATREGIEILGDFTPLPTGDALLTHYLSTLPEGESKVLRFIADQYPRAIDRETISNQTSYQRSTRDKYIQHLVARQLVEANKEGVKASERLFD